jgi:hypothetical protein
LRSAALIVAMTCRADCRHDHQDAFPGDGDVALLSLPDEHLPVVNERPGKRGKQDACFPAPAIASGPRI